METICISTAFYFTIVVSGLIISIYMLLKEFGIWPETWHKKYYEKDTLKK
jgi:hypothetical protein